MHRSSENWRTAKCAMRFRRPASRRFGSAPSCWHRRIERQNGSSASPILSCRDPSFPLFAQAICVPAPSTMCSYAHINVSEQNNDLAELVCRPPSATAIGPARVCGFVNEFLHSLSRGISTRWKCHGYAPPSIVSDASNCANSCSPTMKTHLKIPHQFSTDATPVVSFHKHVAA